MIDKLRPEEKLIVGNWIFSNGKMKADDNTLRIEFLIKNSLLKITSDETGWDVLYQDKNDRRYWELIYYKSEMHGGGPPLLQLIAEEDVQKKYKLV